MSEAPLKIGVFACDCGLTLRERIDFDIFASVAPDVLLWQHSDLCSERGGRFIYEQIKMCNPDRILFAACTGDVHGMTFARVLVSAGFDPYYSTIAGLREHCAWVTDEKEEATTLALEMLRGGIGRLKILGKLEEEPQELSQTVVIVGSGAAGLHAADALISMGHEVIMVERRSEIPAWGIRSESQNEGYTVEESSDNLLEKLKNAGVRILRGARVSRLEGCPGNYLVEVTRDENLEKVQAGALILATGFATRFNPERYGLNAGMSVLSFASLGQTLAAGIQKGKTLAIVLDRVAEESALYSEIAMLLASSARRQGAEVFILYQNIKVAEDHLERLYRGIRDSGVIFIRFERPPQFHLEQEAVHIEVEDTLTNPEGGPAHLEICTDLVALPEEAIPASGTDEIASLLSLNLGPGGFYQEENVRLLPLRAERGGIFFAGGALGARNLALASQDGIAAAVLAHESLQPRVKSFGRDGAVVAADKCILCLTCFRSCPHKAIAVEYIPSGHLGKAARVLASACQGCGICAAVCPVKAVQLSGYRDEEILAEIGAR